MELRGQLRPPTHWIWGWVDPRPGLETSEGKEMSCPCRVSNRDSSVVHHVAQPINRPGITCYPDSLATEKSCFKRTHQIRMLPTPTHSVTRVIYSVPSSYLSYDSGEGQEYKLDWSNEKLRSVMYSQGGQEYPAYSKKGSITELVTSCIGTVF